MPATYYAGLWDRALSFHLYTGRQQQLTVLLPAQRTLGLVPELRRQFVESRQARGFRELNVDHWSDRELKVPLVSEERILRRFMERWCAIGFPEGDLYIRGPSPVAAGPARPARHLPGAARGSVSSAGPRRTERAAGSGGRSRDLAPRGTAARATHRSRVSFRVSSIDPARSRYR